LANQQGPDIKSGVRVAVSPIFTDLPIIHDTDLGPNNNKRVVLKRVWYKYGMMAKTPSRQLEKNEETDVINR
jgi:hypothetical protein